MHGTRWNLLGKHVSQGWMAYWISCKMDPFPRDLTHLQSYRFMAGSGKRSADDASGYDVSDSPRARKKAKTGANKILHYQDTIQAKWEQLCTKWGTVPTVKEVAALSANPSNTNKPLTFIDFSDQVVGGGLCAIGQVASSRPASTTTVTG